MMGNKKNRQSIHASVVVGFLLLLMMTMFTGCGNQNSSTVSDSDVKSENTTEFNGNPEEGKPNNQGNEEHELGDSNIIIIKNGVVEQFSGDLKDPTAVVIKDGIIEYVGDDEGAMKFDEGLANVIDAQGNTIMPAMTEAHMHFSTALREYEVDLADVLDITEMQDVISKFIEEYPDLEVYAGGGWTVSVFENNSPTRQILDEVCPDKPVILQEVDGHAYWVNTKALELVGIDKAFAEQYNKNYQQNGGRIVVDEDGEPTGHLKEAAANLIHSLKPDYTIEQCKEAIKKQQQWLASIGFTSAFDAGILALSEQSAENYLLAMKEMSESGELKFRVRGSFWVQPYDFENWEECEAYLDQWIEKASELDGGENYKINTVKIMSDQVLEEATAYMSEGMYKEGILENEDIESNNIWAGKEDIMLKTFAYAAEHDLNLHIHQIGNQAAHYTLDLLEEAVKEHPELKENNRVCFAHCQFIDEEDKARMADLGVSAIVAPYWAVMDDYYWDVYLPLMSSQELLDTQYPMQSLFDAGVNVAFHSDYFVTIPDMGWLYYSAKTRVLPQKIYDLWYEDSEDYIRVTDTNDYDKVIAESEAQVIGPLKPWNEVLTLDEILEASTMNGAKTINLSDKIGSIEVGKDADLLILNMNVREVSTEELQDVKPIKTFFRGEVVAESM